MYTHHVSAYFPSGANAPKGSEARNFPELLQYERDSQRGNWTLKIKKEKVTVFTQIRAAAIIKLFLPQMLHLRILFLSYCYYFQCNN